MNNLSKVINQKVPSFLTMLLYIDNKDTKITKVTLCDSSISFHNILLQNQYQMITP